MMTKNDKKSNRTKAVVIAVSVTAAGVIGYLVFKNRNAFRITREVIELKKADVEIEVSAAKEVFKTVDVTSHIRHLPKGQHPSENALKNAVEKAIELGENETIVSAYQRTKRTAA